MTITVSDKGNGRDWVLAMSDEEAFAFVYQLIAFLKIGEDSYEIVCAYCERGLPPEVEKAFETVCPLLTAILDQSRRLHGDS